MRDHGSRVRKTDIMQMRDGVHWSEETAGTRVQSKSSYMVLRRESKGRALPENQRQVLEKQNFKNEGGRSFSGF